MPHVITITGPSGAGKSTTVRYLQKPVDQTFKPRLIPKYTTRPPHIDDEGEVICVEAIPRECDLIYEQYEFRYGLALGTIFDTIANGQSPLVILNDIRAVEDVRNSLRRLVRALFIFRKSPTLQEYGELAANVKGVIDEKERERRFKKAQAIYRIYIENIHLFDHVIVNSGTEEELETQVKQIIKGLSQDLNWPLHEKGGI
jgi:guanylate kinase